MEKIPLITINRFLLGALVVGIVVGVSALVLRERAKKASDSVFTLPDLPYAYDALEPHIDKQTMEIHHKKHHQKYVDELNAALKEYPELRKKSVEELLSDIDAVPEPIRKSVRNNGGGHANHSFFWLVMTPQGTKEPMGEIKALIDKKFGSFAQFKDEFSNAAKKVFGSGWAWLVIDKGGELSIMTTKDQDSPLSQGFMPLLGLDVWEHAYYLKYQNERPRYIDAWWNVVNWKQVESNYSKAQSKK